MISTPNLKFNDVQDYLTFSAGDLLEAYGAGSHIPGSGSAAAFSALIAIELLRTVCKLTLQKPKYLEKHKDLEFILTELETKYKPRLLALFSEDIRIFNEVSVNRILRDNADNRAEKERHSRNALRQQKRATEVPIEICKLALEIFPYAVVVFDHGFKSARCDSGVAISSLLSAMSGGLFIVFLNLKSFQKGKWFWARQMEAEDLARRFADNQRNAFSKVLQLYEEGLRDDQKQLRFEFFT